MTEAIKAFIKAQSEMGAALKSAKNPFFKTNYADLSAVQSAVYPPFHANGFAIVQTGGADEFGQYIETRFIHQAAAPDMFTSRVYLAFKQGDMQSLGSAISYARRYGMCAVSGVFLEDDDANRATGRAQPEQVKQPDVMERAQKLSRFIERATAEQLSGMADKANALIAELKTVDEEFAARLEFMWTTRETELGI
mgnify:CR=1 FL=1|jgi:hypothetical protein